MLESKRGIHAADGRFATLEEPMLEQEWLGGIECSLSKVTDDKKLSGAVDELKGRDVVQRDLGRFEDWFLVSLMKSEKAKCKMLHLGGENPG
ncbi:rna-directed dna polymerase from mobile element jockey-like [Pitangus sulphuratus]|nr:rna-directed dna polymerase from mobile element jockey-like [Pitangus sulphuratus]